MRRLHIALTIELGTPAPEPVQPQAGPDLDAYVEPGNPDPHPRSELDGRRPIGFAPQEARP